MPIVAPQRLREWGGTYEWHSMDLQDRQWVATIVHTPSQRYARFSWDTETDIFITTEAAKTSFCREMIDNAVRQLNAAIQITTDEQRELRWGTMDPVPGRLEFTPPVYNDEVLDVDFS
jgi:hypothetical protein